MKTFARASLILAFAIAATALTACNTTRGVGEDLESAGDGIQDAAERNGAN